MVERSSSNVKRIICGVLLTGSLPGGLKSSLQRQFGGLHLSWLHGSAGLILAWISRELQRKASKNKADFIAFECRLRWTGCFSLFPAREQVKTCRKQKAAAWYKQILKVTRLEEGRARSGHLFWPHYQVLSSPEDVWSRGTQYLVGNKQTKRACRVCFDKKKHPERLY